MSPLPSRHSIDDPSGPQPDTTNSTTTTTQAASLDNSHPATHEKPIEHYNNESSHPPTTRQQSHPDSVHDDLFLDQNTVDHVVYSKETTISASADSENDMFIKASWQLKVVILLCMLALPVGCHYLEATVGTLKTALKSVSKGSQKKERETAAVILSLRFAFYPIFLFFQWKRWGHTHTHTLCSL